MFISHFIVISLYGNTISGIILNEKKQPIEFANITLFKTNDSLPIATTLSDSLGVFKFSNLGENNYSIEISYLGYITDTIKNISIKDRIDIINIDNRTDTIIVQDNEIQLNEIQLKLSSTTLTEVQVTATKPIYERKADRIIFNVENSVYSQGSDAFQLLSKSPRVQVLQDEINIAGRGSAGILINDRLQRISGAELSTLLKSIPSSDIQKIEVIPNPPAKYDAEGTALINIVLKKDRKQGYNLTVTTSYEQGQYASGKFGTTFNYNKNKISFNCSAMGARGRSYRNETHLYKYSSQNWRDTIFETQKFNNIYGKMGLDIKINEHSSFGIQYIGVFDRRKSQEQNQTKIFNTQDLLQSYINSPANFTRTNQTHTATIYYTAILDTNNKKLDIGMDFFYNKNYKQRNYDYGSYNINDSLLSNPIPKEQTTGTQTSFIYSIMADMEHPVKYGTWQYGSKFTLININSNNQQDIFNYGDNLFINDTSRSNIFKYKEYIGAVYSSFLKSFKKVELQIGLRLEYTQLKGTLTSPPTINKQKYFRVFPSLLIQYNFNDKNTFNFTVNTRIERPRFWQLNPFRFYVNQYSYSQGNPFLKPLNSYNLSAEYVYKQNYSFSLYYNYNVNDITQINYSNTTTNDQFWRWESNRKIHDFGTYEQFTFNVKDRWDIITFLDVSVDKIKSPFLY